MTKFKNKNTRISFDFETRDALNATVLKSVQIYGTKEGYLECKTCPTPTFWCEHIEYAVVKTLDAPTMWDDESDNNHQSFWIPVFPQKYNLFGRVSFNGALPNLHAVKAYFIPDGMPDEMKEHFLGFVHQGEARSVVRSMLLDYASAYVEQPDLICHSSSHGFAEQMEWEARLKMAPDSAQRIAEAFSILNTQMCVACADPITSNNDLIPR